MDILDFNLVLVWHNHGGPNALLLIRTVRTLLIFTFRFTSPILSTSTVIIKPTLPHSFYLKQGNHETSPQTRPLTNLLSGIKITVRAPITTNGIVSPAQDIDTGRVRGRPDPDIVGFSTEIIYLHKAQHGPRTGTRTARTRSELLIRGRSSRTDPVHSIGDSRGSRRVHLVFLTGEISIHRTQHGVLNFGTIHSGTTALSGAD